MESKKRKTENTSPPTVPEWVKEALECPVCLDIITDTPIFMCGSDISHSLCSKCFEPIFRQGLNCPVCRAALTRKRNHLAEKLVGMLPKVPCIHVGCSFTNADAKVVKKHQEDECEHRDINCGLCDEKISLSKMVEHLENWHAHKKFKSLKFSCERKIQATNLLDESGRLSKNLTIQRACEVTTGGNSPCFLLNLTTDQKFLVFWMAFCGPKYQAENYKYTFKVMSMKDNKAGKTEFLYEGTRRCVPCDATDVIEEGSCILINEKLVQQASDYDNGDIIYCFKIDEV